jgi:hypothetical protein
MGPFSRDKNNDSELEYSVSSFKINQEFSNAFGEGLKNIPSRQVSLNLHANDLDDNAFLEILNSAELIKNLKISNNPKISKISYEALSFRSLNTLSLENNKIGNSCLQYLMEI